MSEKFEKYCLVDGCDRPISARKMCIAHYARWRKSGDPGSPEIKIVKYQGPCEVTGCDSRAIARRYCSMHYQRWHKYGDPVAEWVETRPRSESHTDYAGREWNVNRVSGGYVGCDTRVDGVKIKSLFHRVIMQDVLGRDLLPGENVHHKNGDRSDNRPQNLELWSSSQPSGQRISDKIDWALEIIQTYGSDSDVYR